MKSLLIGNVVVVINMCLYIALFIYCLYKYKWQNISTFLSLLYAFSSISSYLLYNFPHYNIFYTAIKEPTIDGCLYLYIFNTFLILTFSPLDLSKYKKISNYNPYWLKKCQKYLIILLFIYVIVSLPTSIINFFKTSDLSEARNELYGTNKSGSNLFISLISRILGSMPIVLLAITSVRIFLFTKMDRWDKGAICLYILLKLNTIFAVVARAVIVFSFLELLVLFIMFYAYISKEIKKTIIKWALILVPSLFLVFVTISSARFSDGKKDSMAENLATLRYSGESQLNFMGWLYPDLRDPIHGYRQLTLFRRLIGIDYDDGLGRDGTSVYNPYISKTYKYPHPTYVFYSLAGDYVMNWGLIIPMLLVIYVSTRLRRYYRRKSISFFVITLSLVLASYYAKGVFYSEYQSESGNILILFLFFIYLYLKINGKTYTIYNKF